MGRGLTAAAAAALVLVVSGCGDEGAGGASGAASAIPPDPLVYVEVDISGEGEQHDNLDAILSELGQVPLLGTPVDPKALITQALEDLGADNGVDISYAEDFEPWLGDTLAVGYTSLADEAPGFVLSIAVDDEQIARDSLERITASDPAAETGQEYDGVTYQVGGSGEYAVGVFDEKLVLATVDEFESAVDASRGDSLASDGDASEALDVLGDDRLAALYVDTGAALDLAVAEGDAEAEEAEAARAAVPEIFEQPLVASLAAGERTLAVDVAVGHTEDAPLLAASDRLAEAPGDSFAAVAVASLGDQIEALLARVEPILEAQGEPAAADVFESATGVSLDEVLATAGDALAYGRGEIPADFVVGLDVAVTGDTDAPAELLAGLERLASDDDQTVLGPPLGGGETGFSAEPTRAAAEGSAIRFINATLDEELRFLVASDRAAAESAPPAGTLGETELFQAAAGALGDDYEMLAFVDLGPVLDAVLGGGSLLDLATGAASPEQAIAGFLADKLGFAATGVRYDGDTAIQRTIVGLG